ncbi:MAG: hypothetical protein R2712_32070 [Vicinamibacterales bacterium]
MASSGTQGADIGGTVRSRLKYVLPAAFVALTVFVVFGGGAAASTPPPDAAGARGLPMLIVPALVIALLLRGRHLVEGLLFGVLAAVVTSVAWDSCPGHA